jgi:replicative DNA helicase
MESIIKTLAGKSTDEYVRYLDLVLDVEKRPLLSPQEVSILEFMKESLFNSGTVPTEDYLVGKFPEFKVPLERAKVLNVTDLRVEYSNLIAKRTNLNVSRELMQVATEVSQSGLNIDHVDRIRQYLSIVDSDDIVDNTESPESFIDFYQKKKTKSAGLMTQIKQIDEEIGGIAPGMMFVIGAYTASFKTVAANNIVYLNKTKYRQNIAYISLEVTKEDLLINQLARHSFEPEFQDFSYIANKKIRECTLNPEEEDYLMNVVLPDYFDYSKYGMIKILDETDFKTLSFGEIREVLEAVDDECYEKTGYGLDGIVVDHINLCKFNGAGKKFSSETAEGNAYVSFFRKLGLAFRKDEEGNMRKLSVIILSQINRQGKQKADKNHGRYTLNALAEFNELERGAQVVMMIYTNEEMKESKEATVQILKNRNGRTIDEPLSVYADGETYVFGDEMEGFSSIISTGEMDDIFSGGMDISNLL